MSNEPGACYKSWVAYDALQVAAAATSYKSVWSVLACECCPVPTCWTTLKEVPLPLHLLSRIRWYDHTRGANVAPQTGSWHFSADDLHRLREHFVGHHQRIELILHALKPSLERVYTLMRHQVEKNELLGHMTMEEATVIVEESQYVANGWVAVSKLIAGVARLDRIKYLAYVPSLAGVSGGNSPNMMPLTAKTGNLEAFFDAFSDDELAHLFQSRSPVGHVAEAFIDCLDSLSRCWLDHVVTATTAIGITCGTKGTPNTALVDRVLKRLYGSRLLKILGSLRQPISGIGIEMRQLFDYQSYPLAENYISLFDDPGSEFGTHSIGFPPRVFDTAKEHFQQLRRAKKTALWEYYYSETRPTFCQEVKKLIGAEHADDIGIGVGSCVTDVLSRIVASVQMITPVSSLNVVLAMDEFVTFQRAAAILGRQGAMLSYLHMDGNCKSICFPDPEILSGGREEKKDADATVRQLIFVSLINSCTQKIMPIEWALDAPNNVIIIVDVTQAVANIPLYLDKLASRPNVFLIGSLIKHARCGEGLGFMTYARLGNRPIMNPASGWTAHMSGLIENQSVAADTQELLYDTGLEWEGGTPSAMEAMYVAVQVLRALPSIEAQHEYVQNVKDTFIARIHHLLSESQVAAISDSNTLSIPVSKVIPDLPFGLDYKKVSGTTYLRVGFGIHNLNYHLGALVDFLESTNALQ